MPQAIPIIIAVVAEQGAVAIAMAVVSAAVNTYGQIKARRDARNARNASIQGRNITLRTAVSPRRLVLGTVRIGGTLVYGDTVGFEQNRLDLASAICDGPIAGVTGYWLNETFYSAADMTGDRPASGKYAKASRPTTGTHTVTLSGSATFALPNAPVRDNPNDLLVSLLLSGDGGMDTLTVSSVSGVNVTLSAPVTGTVYVNYKYYLADAAPLRIQWTDGRQTVASSWSGITTPNQGATDVRRGIVELRTLMRWDENIYTGGAPTVNVLVQGANEVFDPRLNRNPSVNLTGGEVGNPGVLPTGLTFNGVDGMAASVVAFGDDPNTGYAYVDVRFAGTATEDGEMVLNIPGYASGPAASTGQVWSARCGLRTISGSFNFGGLRAFQVSSYTAAGARATVGSTTITTAPSVAASGAWFTASGTISQASAAKAGICLRLGVLDGGNHNCVLRIFLPLLWQGAIGSSADPLRYTANSALLAAWYGTRPRSRLGCGRPWSLVNWASVSAAANICDELMYVKKLDGTGYEWIKRYECHTVLSAEDSPADNLRTILSTMAGEFPFTAGAYQLYAGAYRAPTLVITDADVAVGQPIRIAPSVSGLEAIPNKVTAEFVDAAQNYVETTPNPVSNPTYLANNGGEEEVVSMRLLGTTDSRRANYLQGLELERLQPRHMAELTVTGIGADIALLRGVMIDLEGFEAFAATTWEVRGRTNHFNGRYTLKLSETRSSSWALDPDTYTPIDPPAPPDLDWVWLVSAVSGLGVTPGTPSKLPDGTTILRLPVVWTLHPQWSVQEAGAIELRYRRATQTTWTYAAPTNGNATGTTLTIAADDARYILEARARNGVGAFSAWTTIAVDVASGSLVSNVKAALSLANIVLPANSAGVVGSYTGAASTVQIELNGVNDTSNWTLARANSSGLTANLSGATLTVTALADVTDSAYSDITATRSGYPTQTLRVQVTKTKAGASAPPPAPGPVSNVRTVWAGDVQLGTTPAEGAVRVEDNGLVSVRSGTGGSFVAGPNWYSPTTAAIGDDYYVKAVKTAGDALYSGTLGTWLAISTEPTWVQRAVGTGGTVVVKSTTLLLSYATSASDAAIVGTQVVYLQPEGGGT